MKFGLILCLLTSAPVLATPATDFDTIKINKRIISIEETTPDFNTLQNLNFGSSEIFTNSTEANPLSIADLLIKAWEIIKDGAPVVNVKHKNVTALPVIANQNWSTLTGWKSERTVTYGISTTNGFGITTVDLEYQVKLLYGGNYQGKGQYIASARVVPTKVDVMWGYNLDVTVDVPAILNMGSETDPTAAIQLDVTYKISTVLRSYSESESFDLRGNGFMKNTKTGEVFF